MTALTAHLGADLPLRSPDLTSEQVMTRRAWWLVILNFLFPGSAQVVAGNRTLGRVGITATIIMWVLVIIGALMALLWRPVLLSLGTTPAILLVLQLVMVAFAILWVVLTLDTLRLVRLVRTRPRARAGIAALTTALLVLAGGGAVYSSQLVGTTRDVIASIFGGGKGSVAASDGYYNIMLLGADSGKGRDHMLFDSISVVSVNADTGAVVITGLPRDMRNVPFAPGPMKDLYPDGHQGHMDPTCGWANKLNQLNTEVGRCMDGAAMYPHAKKDGSTPGIEATRDAAEGVLGISIPYYVFIDMDGFARLIDALGGVEITATSRLPEGALHKNEDGSLSGITGWIKAGKQHMDGKTAQWYARSRYTTSDWDRMKRQRQLQTAILKQFTPANVLTHFQDIAKAGTTIVETDIPSSMLPYFTELALKAKSQKVTTIELTNENGIDPDNPDFAQIHAMIKAALHPASPSPSP